MSGPAESSQTAAASGTNGSALSTTSERDHATRFTATVPAPSIPLRTASHSQRAEGSDKKRKLGERTVERMASVDVTTEDEGGSPSGGRPGKEPKRTRVHFSCVECHRRKQKCDRKEPCSQCVARRVPHLCRPFLNGVEDLSNADVHARLSTIEGMLSRLITLVPQAMTRPPPAVISGDAGSPDVSSLAPSGDDIFHPQSQPTDQPPRQIYASKPPPSGVFPGSLSTSTPPGRSGFGWGLREGRMISLSIDDSPDLRDILSTLRESGISKNHLEWLIAGVPGRRMADALVELYFRDIEYKMNRPSFERKYALFFDSISKNPASPRIDGDALRWLPLLFIVLAIAVLSAPNDLVKTEEQGAWSRRFYGSARSGIEYAKALQRDNLDVLFAGLLASRYMLLVRRPAEGSTPLTTAFQLGLYRDGTVLNLSDKREIEIRRRAWAMLYHLDRTISLLVGRPAAILDTHTDTQPPANLDDEEVESGNFDPAGHPLTVPTVYTYVIVRHQLARIMGRIAFHTFAIALPDYATVVGLDKDLLNFRETLPGFLAMADPDTSFDSTHPYLFVQRHLLASEWYYARITLNRPYLLRRKPQDDRYTYSKNAAIESATADLLNRRAFIMSKGGLVINSGGYRVLNSYMVLGVTIKHSPQADELRTLLNVVSGRARDAAGRLSEPIVKEELAIVEFLTAKASGSKATPSVPRDDENTADMLLELAQTNSGRRAVEEERRQMRLQQRREVEEARARHVNGQAVSSSPWGYVAPQMPGLNVHQPFGNGPRRGPRPLMPPSAKRDDIIEWDGETFPGLNGDFSQFGSFDQGANASTFDNLMPFNGMGTVGNGSATEMNGGNVGNGTAFSDAEIHAVVHNSIHMGVGPGVPDQALFMPTDAGMGLQFGNGSAFDMSGLHDTNDNTQSIFNPFAIAQTGEEGPANEPSPDEETAFLNYILTKFANSQPDLQ